MSIRKLQPFEQEDMIKVRCIAFNMHVDFLNPQEDPFPSPTEWEWGYFDNGRLVSGIAAIPYRMRFDGHNAGLCGIGNVSTLPEYRRGGKIFAIFQKIFEDEYEKGTEFSSLSPFSHSFYRRVGYELCNCRQNITSKLRSFDILPARGAFIQHFPGGPFDELEAVFNKYIENLNHAIPRDCQPDQRLWQRFTRNDPYKTGICTYIWHNEKDEPKGYIKIKQNEKPWHNDELYIQELAFADSDALYGTLSILSRLQGTDVTWPAPAYIPFSDIMPENWNFSTSIITRDMTRIIHVERALKLMRRPEGRGVYRIEVNDPQLPGNNGVFQVEYDDAGSEVTRVGAPADLTASIQALSQLVTGFRTLDSVLFARKDLTLHGNVDILRKVFTARPSHLTEEF